MLAIAFAGQRAAHAFRAHALLVRRVSGVLVAGAALAIAFGVDRNLQTALPGYTEALQKHFERSDAAQRELRELTGGRDPEATGGGDGEARGLRPGTRLPRDRALAQLGAADAPRAARPRRPGRLLDVLVHQLPPDAAPHPRLGRALPRRRADDRRRPLARVRVRARRVERARERAQARRPLPGRAGQRLRHLAVVAQPVLARQVPDRQARPRALLPLRRGRVREDRGRDQDAARRRRAGAVRPCGREPARAA